MSGTIEERLRAIAGLGEVKLVAFERGSAERGSLGGTWFVVSVRTKKWGFVSSPADTVLARAVDALERELSRLRSKQEGSSGSP